MTENPSRGVVAGDLTPAFLTQAEVARLLGVKLWTSLPEIGSRYRPAIFARLTVTGVAFLSYAGRRARFVDRRAEELKRVSQRTMAQQPRWRFVPPQPRWRFVPPQRAEHVRGRPTPEAYAGRAAQLDDVVKAAATRR